MSNTTPATTEPTNAPEGTLEHLDPNSIAVGENVRDDHLGLGKDFLASLTEHGVLVPLTAVRDDDGTVRVLNGQRRCLGAREVGLASIPVYVVAHATADEAAATVERIVHQMVTNDQKADLTEAQRARGIQQMLDAGLSATKIAKKLSVKRDTVTAVKAAAGSTQAMDALAAGQLSLIEAAAVAEFEDDPDATERLIDAAGTPQFDHWVARLRQDREDLLARRAAAVPYAEKGYQVLEDRPRGYCTDWYPLSCLRRQDGTAADETDIEEPRQWGVYVEEGECWVDKATGTFVSENDIDPDTWDDSEATPAEGKRHADEVEEGTAIFADFYCTDYAAAGLRAPAWMERRAEAKAATPDPAGMTEEDRAAAEEEKLEAERRDRRKVLALNKLGQAATEVRRAHVTRYLLRKNPDKGTATFIAQALIRDPAILTLHSGVAAELLAAKDHSGLRETIAGLGEGNDPRAQLFILGMILGSLEGSTGKDAWRTPGNRTSSYATYGLSSAEYLTWLRDNTRYALAPIEEVIVGSKNADELYDELTAAKE